LTVVGAPLSGVVVMSIETALFEGRPAAALELHAILRATLDARLGLIWMVRQGLLLVLAVFSFSAARITQAQTGSRHGAKPFYWAVALALIGSSSHLTAMSESSWAQGVAMLHLLSAGVWVGGLPPLALLLYDVSQKTTASDP